MSSDTPAHDFLRPALIELIGRAEAQGIRRDVAVAVLTDLITGPQFNDALPDPAADSQPLPAQDAGPTKAERMVQEKNNLIEQVVQPRGII